MRSFNYIGLCSESNKWEITLNNVQYFPQNYMVDHNFPQVKRNGIVPNSKLFRGVK